MGMVFRGRRASGGAGFTLIELLVVVAVIGVLLAALAPSLASARERARCAVCQSNCRSLFVALSVYADDHDDRMPLGFSLGPGPGWKQYNYLLRSGSSTGDAAMRWMGLLYEHGAFESPDAFYCPSETDPLLSFDTEDNPWPPDETAPAGKSTRIGYGTRPLIGWPFPRGRAMPGPLPRRSGLGKLGPEALLADLVHKPQRVEGRHGDRVHHAQSDGSVSFTDYDALAGYATRDLTWEYTRASSFDTAFNDLFLELDEGERPVGGLWTVLDGR